MTGPRLHHLALRVADPELSARFYAEVFGLPSLKTHQDSDGTVYAVWLGLGDSILMLERSLRPRGPEVGSAHVLVLVADDLVSAAQRLAEAGVEIADRSEYTLYFLDPDGHRLGLSAYRITP